MTNEQINLINNMYGSDHEEPEQYTKEEEPKKQKKIRLSLRILIIVLLVGVFFFTNVIFSHNSLITSLGKISFWQGIAKLVSGKEKVLKGELTDRINILFLGMGGAQHEGPYLTDTIILASIKPSTNHIKKFQSSESRECKCIPSELFYGFYFTCSRLVIKQMYIAVPDLHYIYVSSQKPWDFLLSFFSLQLYFAVI